MKALKFNNVIEKWLIEKATKTNHLYNWTLETKAGPLRISLDDPVNRAKVLSLYTCFEDVKRGSAITDGESNPFSGKWNFNYFSKDHTALELATIIINQLESIT